MRTLVLSLCFWFCATANADSSGPTAPPAGSTAALETFEGSYLAGFEASYFRPGPGCGDRSARIWLEATRKSGFWKAVKAAGGVRPLGEARAFRVRFEGQLSGPGRY